MKPTPPDHIFVANLLVNNKSAHEKLDGVQLLFDGKTTNGWRGVYKDKFLDKGWQVKNGEISVLQGNGSEATNGGDIVTLKEHVLLYFSSNLN